MNNLNLPLAHQERIRKKKSQRFPNPKPSPRNIFLICCLANVMQMAIFCQRTEYSMFVPAVLWTRVLK